MPSLAPHSRPAWLVHLCTLTVFVLGMAWATRASAAVPMCGARGQSIAAPPIGTPASNDALSAGTPCEPSGPLHALGAPQRKAPPALSFYEQPTRALPILPWVAPSPVSARVSRASEARELDALGFSRSIDRPPRF